MAAIGGFPGADHSRELDVMQSQAELDADALGDPDDAYDAYVETSWDDDPDDAL